jgi:hypothetical protein
MPTFFTDLGVNPTAEASYVTDVKGNVVALLQAGCCAGAILINFFAGKHNCQSRSPTHLPPLS